MAGTVNPRTLFSRAMAWVSCLLVPWGGYYGLAVSGIAARVGAPREALLAGWERHLLGGLSVPERMAPFMAFLPFRWLMVGTYLSFYGALLGVPAVLLSRGDDARFRALRKGLLIAGLAGYALYFALPSRSPYYVLPIYQGPSFQFSQSLVRSALEGKVAFPYDAFPSMHVAFAVVLTATAGDAPWRWIWLGLLALATVATGAHWGLDVVAGAVLGGGAWFVARSTGTRP